MKIVQSDHGQEFPTRSLHEFFQDSDLFIRPRVLTVHNKMDEWRGSIVTYLMWYMPCNFKHTYHLDFGENVSWRQPTK